jgi:hypothetical protein
MSIYRKITFAAICIAFFAGCTNDTSDSSSHITTAEPSGDTDVQIASHTEEDRPSCPEPGESVIVRFEYFSSGEAGKGTVWYKQEGKYTRREKGEAFLFEPKKVPAKVIEWIASKPANNKFDLRITLFFEASVIKQELFEYSTYVLPDEAWGCIKDSRWPSPIIVTPTFFFYGYDHEKISDTLLEEYCKEME